jgi:hypothetical protein
MPLEAEADLGGLTPLLPLPPRSRAYASDCEPWSVSSGDCPTPAPTVSDDRKPPCLLCAQPCADEDVGPMPRDGGSKALSFSEWVPGAVRGEVEIDVEDGAVILPPRGAAVFVAPPVA